MEDLSGVRILTTRERDAAEAWSEVMRTRGAIPMIVPLIQVRRLRCELWDTTKRTLSVFVESGAQAVVGFASAKGVIHWEELLDESGLNPGVSHCVAVGTATARKASELGYNVTLASPSNASGLAQTIAKATPANAAVVLPRALHGRTEAIELLKQAGRSVVDLPVYHTVPVESPEPGGDGTADWVISASPSAVAAFVGHRGTLMRLETIDVFTRHAVIGSTTAASLVKTGFAVHAVAPEPTIDSVLNTIAVAPPNPKNSAGLLS